MKNKQISIYIILLMSLSSLFMVLPHSTNAQERKIRFKSDVEKEEAEKKLKEKQAVKENVSFYQGVTVGADVSGLIGKVLGSDYTYGDVSVQVNLKNRYLPIAEIGYGKTDITNEDTNIHFTTSAPYLRIGMDYNMMHKKPHLPGYISLGFRIGHTSMKYDVEAPTLVDPNWQDLEIPIDYKDVKNNTTWLELVAGVKARVFKGIGMGWSIRYRSRISTTQNENSEPYYIPGYGRNGKSNFGFSYNITYDLPF